MDGAIAILKEMWDVFKEFGVIGIYAMVMTVIAVMEARVIWQLLQFLKQYIGKENAKKS